MPLLPLETYLYPETLLNETDLGATESSRWWILHTRPRAEKGLARALVSRTVSFFLPLYRHQRNRAGRQLTSYLPLFSGYLFLHGDEESRLHALETNLVARALPVPDQGRLHGDLTGIHRLMTSGMALMPEGRLQPGARVRVVVGPLAGLEGTVLRRERQGRLLIEVHMLQQGVSVELDGWTIEPVPDRR